MNETASKSSRSTAAANCAEERQEMGARRQNLPERSFLLTGGGDRALRACQLQGSARPSTEVTRYYF